MNQNEALKNPVFTTTSDVKDICAEYFRDLHINLHFFSHGTVYPDGQFSGLISDPEWAKWHFIDQELPPSGYTVYDQIKNSVKLPLLDSGAEAGWSDESIQFAKERFGIENFMVIVRKYNDHFETFFFDVHDQNAYEQFINHFDIFENFIFYYKDKAQDLIKTTHDNPLITPEKYFNADIPISNTLNNNELAIDPEGITQTNRRLPTRYFLNHNDRDHAISKREYQCLSLIAHGGKFKAIAQTLNISTRTIETHLNNIKTKLMINTLADAIAIYWKNRLD